MVKFEQIQSMPEPEEKRLQKEKMIEGLDKKPEQNLKTLKKIPSQEEILTGFSDEQKQEIQQKQKILSSLAYFIGKDFQIPIELNEPGEGWHWDFKENKICIDPKDLLEKPMDYLRFIISHEGGHRRVSRTEFIPLEEWQEPGFAFMMNAIEDPRTNNFVAESYSRFREQMELTYNHDLDIESKLKEKAQKKLGYQPRFMRAGFEYIKQWFRETKGEEFELSEDLPDDVRNIVQKTLEDAQDSWLRYPSREEADESEDLIKKYAELSYRINRDKVWPEFKKLVEEDLKDQEVQEMMRDMQKDKAGGEEQGIPQGLKDKLSEEEQKELREAIEKAIEDAKKREESDEQGGGLQEDAEEKVKKGAQVEKSKEGEQQTAPVDLSSLSDELKQKIHDFIDSLSEEKKKELEDKAKKVVDDFAKDLADELSGELSDNPDKKSEREEKGEEDKVAEAGEESPKPKQEQKESGELKKYRDLIEKALKKDETVYEENRRDVLPIIDKLENDLREIFTARRAQKWQVGFKSGKRIDIKRRIQEKAKGVPAIESKAWKKRELPQEKDYAISILVDLSGSMQGEKIEDTFKAVIVLTEVLNRLSVNTEILGFNDRLYEYQNYGEQISKEIRDKMGGMLKEVSDFSDTGKARYNDDGWALEQASERLRKQKASEKFLIVLSDGRPEESPGHSGRQYNLNEVVKNVLKGTNQKLIGLGIGHGTKHVEEYYPNSIADVSPEEMAEKLSSLIKEVIANYDRF